MFDAGIRLALLQRRTEIMERVARYASVLLASLLWSTAGLAAPACPEMEQFLTGKAVGVVCFHSDDLRTNNPATTPANNSILTFADGSPLPGLFGGSGGFTPVTDRGVISNGPTPTSTPVPGIQIEGWFADDPTTEARFVLRFPNTGTGRGATTFSPRDTPTRRKTRVCSICTLCRSPPRRNPRQILWRAG